MCEQPPLLSRHSFISKTKGGWLRYTLGISMQNIQKEMHGYDMLRFTGINNPEGFHMMNIPQGETMSLNQV